MSGNNSENYPAANDVSTACTVFRSADQDNVATAVKTAEGNLYGFIVENPNGSKAYLQFYDTAAAGVTVGTTTPVLTVFVPANGATDCFPVVPLRHFSTAMTIAATTTAAGGTDPTTGLVVNVFYK